jgi:3-methyladenine DNA glycosylase AlkD
VERRRPVARALGRRLAEHLEDPAAFERHLEAGLRRLADPVYRDAHVWLAPEASVVVGVRQPLLRAVESGLRQPLRVASPAIAIYLADRLTRSELHEARLLGLACIRRSLAEDPERSWQLLRRLGHQARDWITVDTLADVEAEGILQEGYRWAELEQLVYAASAWERRLVGATIARVVARTPADARPALGDRPALPVLRSLLGDPSPDVGRAVAWALRAWRAVDPAATATLLRAEAETARATDDGARAWVIRAALGGSGADPSLAAELRAELKDVRRAPGALDTSRAHAAAVAFAAGGLGPAGPTSFHEPPLVPGTTTRATERSTVR